MARIVEGAAAEVGVQEIVLEEAGRLEASRDEAGVEPPGTGYRASGAASCHSVGELLGDCHIGFLPEGTGGAIGSRSEGGVRKDMKKKDERRSECLRVTPWKLYHQRLWLWRHETLSFQSTSSLHNVSMQLDSTMVLWLMMEYGRAFIWTVSVSAHIGFIGSIVSVGMFHALRRDNASRRVLYDWRKFSSTTLRVA